MFRKRKYQLDEKNIYGKRVKKLPLQNQEKMREEQARG